MPVMGPLSVMLVPLCVTACVEDGGFCDCGKTAPLCGDAHAETIAAAAMIPDARRTCLIMARF